MSFKLEIEEQRNKMCLMEIDMTTSPKAFQVARGEKRKADTIFMGLEWEVKLKYIEENSTHKYDWDKGEQTKFGKYIKEQLHKPLHKYVNFRDDFELLEMVTIPATLNAHKKYMEKHLFPTNIQKRVKKHYCPDRVGIHIHVSKKAFTKQHLTRFIQFIRAKDSDSRDFMISLAGRSHYYEGYHATSKAINVDANLVDTGHYGKYQAVNTDGHTDTIEVRIFDSVNSKSKLYARLEFIDALVRYTKKEKNLLTAKDFSCYVKNNMVRYPNLNREVCVKSNLDHRSHNRP